jgi:hypothetical protein
MAEQEHLCGARSPGHLERDQPHGPVAHDGDRIAQADARVADLSHRDLDRLDECGLLVGDRVRQADALPGQTLYVDGGYTWAG